MAIHRLVTALAAALLCTGVARAQAPDTTGRDSLPSVLIGRVLDNTGTGVPGAEITTAKSERVHAVSGDSGDFRIAGLPPGTIVFNVRRIGFEPATFTAVLKPGRTHRANFALSASAQVLPKVSIADTAVPTHWLDVFNSHKSGARGTFITRDQIVKYSPRTGADILRHVPGVRIDMAGRTGLQNRIVMTRGNGARPCIPNMFVHGVPYSGTMDDFNPDDVEAVEVYVGISELPPELDKNGKGICGAIVVWTRDPRKAP
jgi:hypothetical protein